MNSLIIVAICLCFVGRGMGEIVCKTVCTDGKQCACQNPCPATCDNPKPYSCPTFWCNPNCYIVCSVGQVLDRPNGKCIPIAQCSQILLNTCETPSNGNCTGGTNDQYTTCGTNCPSVCGQKTAQVCIDSCKGNVCQCKPGFTRRLSDCQCVLSRECSPYPGQQ